MASITITLSDEILKALKAARSITVALGSARGGRTGAASRAAATDRATRVSGAAGKIGRYRPGSLPAKLLSWAGGRKRPFGVPDLIKKFKIKRGHASMLIAYVTKGGAVKRVGRGAYAAGH